MVKLLLLFAVVGAISILVNIESAMIMPNSVLVNALPFFEAEEAEQEKKINDIIEKHIPQEYRHLVDNLTDYQHNMLGVVLGMHGDDLIIENISDYIERFASKETPPPDPEHEALMKRLNDTATAKAALPFVYAESPVRYNTDEVNDTEIPYTAPGQILIYVSAEYEQQKLNMHREPYEPAFLNETETLSNPWSGNIRFDSGSKSVSYAGMSKDEFIMDCAPGTPYGVIFQNDEDYRSLTVMILGSDYTTSSGSLESLEFEQTHAPYGIISISGTCPSFDPAIAEKLLSYRPENIQKNLR